MADARQPIAAGDGLRGLRRASAARAAACRTTDAGTVAGADGRGRRLGYGTHGVFRLRQYLARLAGRRLQSRAPTSRSCARRVATALIDGDNGLGHLAMAAARDLAMEKARAAGIGWVGVRRGNHAGPLALYVRPQAEAGMIGMAAAVGSANHVPPFGGTDLLLGTNPIAFSAPDAAAPIPSCSTWRPRSPRWARSRPCRSRASRCPKAGWSGRDGKPLTDPARKAEGFLLPIGGPEGLRPVGRHRPAGRAF